MQILCVTQPVLQDMAFTNAVYVSSMDVSLFSGASYVHVGGSYVWKLACDATVEQGTMALNKLARTVTNVSVGSMIDVNPIGSFSFPPFASIHVQVESLNPKCKGSIDKDAFIRDCIHGDHIFRMGQAFFFDDQGYVVKLTVTSTVDCHGLMGTQPGTSIFLIAGQGIQFK